jgi:hypothetical protein
MAHHSVGRVLVDLAGKAGCGARVGYHHTVVLRPARRTYVSSVNISSIELRLSNILGKCYSRVYPVHNTKV